MCASCKTVQFKLDGSTIVMSQMSDNKTAWVELVMTLRTPAPSPHPLRVVQGKTLASAMRGVSTLKDTIRFEFATDGITISSWSPKNGEQAQTVVPFQSERGFRLNASLACTPATLAAGRTDASTRELELALKGSIAAFRVTDDGRVLVDDHELKGFSSVARALTLTFPRDSLLAWIKPSMSPSVAVSLYRDLPLKLTYTLTTAKRSRSSSAAEDVVSAWMQVYVAPSNSRPS